MGAVVLIASSRTSFVSVLPNALFVGKETEKTDTKSVCEKGMLS